MALLNIPLTIYLITLLGVVGAAVSTGIAIILGYAMIAVLLQRRAGLPMLTYFLQTARGIAPVFVVVVGSGVVLQRWMPENWFGLIAGATIFALIYAQSMFVLAANPDERKLIRKVWTSVFRVGSWAT
jgi:O-antigen/teichoic acid export membrane protein